MRQVAVEWGKVAPQGGGLSKGKAEDDSMGHLHSLLVIQQRQRHRLAYNEAETHTGLIDQRCWVLS